MTFSNQQAIAENADLLGKTLFLSRIIVFAMMTGLVWFIVIVIAFMPRNMVVKPVQIAVPANVQMPVLTVVAIAMAATILPLSVAIPGVIGDGMRRRLAARSLSKNAGVEPADVPALIQIYQQKLIIAAAMTEGVGFFAIVVYMLERNPIALALAVLDIVFLAVRLPVRARVEFWLDGQLDKLQAERRDLATS